MSDIPVQPVEPSGEGLAERYIDKELHESRASLSRTRIIAGLLTVGIVGYMVYLTSGFHQSLEPRGAAEITTGLAAQRLDDLEPQVASYIHEQVPQLIRKAPDEVIARLPEYRESLEDRVEADLREQAREGAKELSSHLDTFLSAHKEQVAALIQNGQDPQATEEMGAGLEEQFRTFLREQKIAGTSIDEKLSTTLSTLKQVQARTAKLAANKGLTPEEKNARHAIALLMHRIEAAKASSPPLPTIDHAAAGKAISDVAEKVHAGVKAN
ncbi:hypothetical protein EON82_01390 [bacterium]|nr:MAG: hypothetical protein EON82_01390 [bacterium]